MRGERREKVRRRRRATLDYLRKRTEKVAKVVSHVNEVAEQKTDRSDRLQQTNLTSLNTTTASQLRYRRDLLRLPKYLADRSFPVAANLVLVVIADPHLAARRLWLLAADISRLRAQLLGLHLFRFGISRLDQPPMLTQSSVQGRAALCAREAVLALCLSLALPVKFAHVPKVLGPTSTLLLDRKSTRLNSSHGQSSRMPSSA